MINDRKKNTILTSPPFISFWGTANRKKNLLLVFVGRPTLFLDQNNKNNIFAEFL